MDAKKITIRPATKEDADLISRIVIMALGAEPDTHPLREIFKELASREVAQYSYHNVLVAEMNGIAAGALVGYDGARLYELRAPLLEMVAEKFGEPFNIEDEAQPDEFYLDSLTVLPEYRGNGIGRQLIESMCDKAFSAGYERVGLLVDWENPSAEKLYRSIGFRRINPTTFLGHQMWHMQLSQPSEQ